MHRLNVLVRFEASHQLTKMPEGHKCARLHGHSYKAEICIEGVPDANTKMLIDAGLVKDHIRRWFDHQHLNDVLASKTIHGERFPEPREPTAEFVAEFTAWQVNELLIVHRAESCRVLRVAIHETESSFVEFMPTYEDEYEDELQASKVGAFPVP